MHQDCTYECVPGAEVEELYVKKCNRVFYSDCRRPPTSSQWQEIFYYVVPPLGALLCLAISIGFVVWRLQKASSEKKALMTERELNGALPCNA